MSKNFPQEHGRDGDPAVWFSDPESAYEALLRWAEKRDEVKERRDPLVRGALRVFQEHGDVERVHRATRLARSTIERIQKASDRVPAVTEMHDPDLPLYAGILRIQADRAREEAHRTRDEKQAHLLRHESTVLDSLAKKVGDTDPWDDEELQALAARLRRFAVAESSGFIDTYEGRLPRAPQERPHHEMAAGHYRAVAEQITQFRLRGDEALDALDPALVAESKRRLEAEELKVNGELFGDEQYFIALREQRTVHGSPETDWAASALLRTAARKRQLQDQIAELTSQLAELSSTEALVEEIEDETGNSQARGSVSGLRAAAASDETIRQALIDVLGPQGAEDFLNGEQERS